MSQEKDSRSKWEKPAVKEVKLEWDKDVLAKCHTASGGNASSDQEGGCQNPEHNVKCN